MVSKQIHDDDINPLKQQPAFVNYTNQVSVLMAGNADHGRHRTGRRLRRPIHLLLRGTGGDHSQLK